MTSDSADFWTLVYSGVFLPFFGPFISFPSTIAFKWLLRRFTTEVLGFILDFNFPLAGVFCRLDFADFYPLFELLMVVSFFWGFGFCTSFGFWADWTFEFSLFSNTCLKEERSAPFYILFEPRLLGYFSSSGMGFSSVIAALFSTIGEFSVSSECAVHYTILSGEPSLRSFGNGLAPTSA